MPFPAWPDLSADALEQQLLARWQEERLFERTLERTKGCPPFVFFEGPPTANGRPGIHHAAGRTIKDLLLLPRAPGRQVTRIAAGTPTSCGRIEVEKELGLDVRRRRCLRDRGVHARPALAVRYQESGSSSPPHALLVDYDHPYVTAATSTGVGVVAAEAAPREGPVAPRPPRAAYSRAAARALGHERPATRSPRPLDHVSFPLDDGRARAGGVDHQPWTCRERRRRVHPDLEYGESMACRRVLVRPPRARARSCRRPRRAGRQGAPRRRPARRSLRRVAESSAAATAAPRIVRCPRTAARACGGRDSSPRRTIRIVHRRLLRRDDYSAAERTPGDGAAGGPDGVRGTKAESRPPRHRHETNELIGGASSIRPLLRTETYVHRYPMLAASS